MIVMRLSDTELEVVTHESFKVKGVVVLSANKEILFSKVLDLFETEDLSEITFYNKILNSDKIQENIDTVDEVEDIPEYRYEIESTMSGYSKLVGFNNNITSGLYTFQLEKPSKEDVIDEELIKNDQLKQMKYAFSAMTTMLTDEQSLNCVDLFVEYEIGKAYIIGDRFKYGNTLYKVIQKHTSQADWKPNVTKSLYVNLADPAIEFPEYVQPTGAHDAYKKGDKVTFENKHYVSTIDNNTWTPKDYPQGWKIVE